MLVFCFALFFVLVWFLPSISGGCNASGKVLFTTRHGEEGALHLHLTEQGPQRWSSGVARHGNLNTHTLTDVSIWILITVFPP